MCANLFDDIVLRNPVYFIFLFICGIGAYITYQLNLWGPMMNMADAASRQAVEEGKRRLREFLEASDTGRQAIAMSASASGGSGRDEYEMSNLKSRNNDEGDDDEI
jgi:hypothetical protein